MGILSFFSLFCPIFLDHIPPQAGTPANGPPPAHHQLPFMMPRTLLVDCCALHSWGSRPPDSVRQ